MGRKLAVFCRPGVVPLGGLEPTTPSLRRSRTLNSILNDFKRLAHRSCFRFRLPKPSPNAATLRFQRHSSQCTLAQSIGQMRPPLDPRKRLALLFARTSSNFSGTLALPAAKFAITSPWRDRHQPGLRIPCAAGTAPEPKEDRQCREPVDA